MSDTKNRIRLGMVGGGMEAFIGAVHRTASRIDDKYELVAGALSSTPERAKQSGQQLGLPMDRTYDSYAKMAKAEAARPDGIEVVAIVTPNHLHFAVAKAFLEQSIHLICDKPVTSNLDDALALKSLIRETGCHFLLTHNYTGYPMAREARRMVLSGAIGPIRLVNMEYIQDWLAGDETGKQAEWRLDPERSGAGGCIGDIGTHACNLAQFISGLAVRELSADLHRFGAGRRLDDNAHILFRFEKGAKGLLWASQVAIGNENGLRIRIFGETGSLEFAQEEPNKLWFAQIGKPKQLLSRGGAGFQGQARLPAGHPEGFLEAFATLYSEFADVIRKGETGPVPLPGIEAGIDGLRFITAAVQSAQDGGRWVAV